MRSALLALCLIGNARLVAQTTWYPPDGSDLAPWIAQAAPGDTIQLAATHAGFVLDKGLTLRGPSVVGNQTGPLVALNGIDIDVPAGQHARLVDITVNGWTFWVGPQDGSITSRGDVVFDGVRLNGGFWTIVTGDVQLHRCTAVGQSWGTAALRVDAGTCVVTECLIRGVNGVVGTPWGGFAATPSPGLLIAGGTVLVAASSITGGIGNAPPGGQPAVACYGGVTRVADGSATGGSSGFGPFQTPYPGAHAALVSGGVLQFARTTLLSGSGAPGSAPAYAIDPNIVGLTCAVAPTRGHLLTVVATAGASQQHLVLAGGFDATPHVVAPFVEPLFGDLSNLAPLLLALPTSGAQVAYSTSVPNQPTLLGAHVWFQAIQLDWPQIRASALAGGVIR